MWVGECQLMSVSSRTLFSRAVIWDDMIPFDEQQALLQVNLTFPVWWNFLLEREPWFGRLTALRRRCACAYACLNYFLQSAVQVLQELTWTARRFMRRGDERRAHKFNCNWLFQYPSAEPHQTKGSFASCNCNLTKVAVTHGEVSE